MSTGGWKMALAIALGALYVHEGSSGSKDSDERVEQARAGIG